MGRPRAIFPVLAAAWAVVMFGWADRLARLDALQPVPVAPFWSRMSS